MFDNVTWPQAVTYNIAAKCEVKFSGGAKVEHIVAEKSAEEEIVSGCIDLCSEVIQDIVLCSEV